MSPKHAHRWLATFLLVTVIGPGVALAGPILGSDGWWWEKHFEGDGYSCLHYWTPSLYRWHAYCRPVKFDTPADPYPLVPPGGQAYPFRDLPAKSAVPGSEKEAPQFMPLAEPLPRPQG